LYHSAFSCNRRYSFSNWLDYKVITTAYPCEVSYDALIQTNNISIERLVSTNQISMLLVNDYKTGDIMKQSITNNQIVVDITAPNINPLFSVFITIVL